MRTFVCGTVVWLALALVGCSSGTSTNPPQPPAPPGPPAPSLAIKTPQDGATLFGNQVNVSYAASNVTDGNGVTVLLNGTDITSLFGQPDSSGVRSAKLATPKLGFGKNQIQLRYQSVRANSSFYLYSAASAAPAPPPPSDPPELITIQTRVLASGADGKPLPGVDGTHPTDWGISVGGKFVQATVPVDQNNQNCTQGCYGYQIVLLDRRDPRNVVKNLAYEVMNEDEAAANNPFVSLLTQLGSGPEDPNPQPYPGCGRSGCIVVMQSLARIGYSPCYEGPQPYGICNPYGIDGNITHWAERLTKLGASAQLLFSNGYSSHIGYSFIGNAGSGNVPSHGAQFDSTNPPTKVKLATNSMIPGGNNLAQFESMTCSDTQGPPPDTTCDNLGPTNTGSTASDPLHAGQMTGVLIKDNYNLFTYSQNAPQITYTLATTASTSTPQVGTTYTNVLAINGAAPTSDNPNPVGYYPFTLTTSNSVKGGFRLIILDRQHPDSPAFPVSDTFYNGYTQLTEFENAVAAARGTRNLFFVAAIGDIRHDPRFGSNNNPNGFLTGRDWDNLSLALHSIGGDIITTRILGDQLPAFDPDGMDDYFLVGKQVPTASPTFENFYAGMPSRFTAQEAGYVINRHTLQNAPWPTQVEGVLVQDHQGFYTPSIQGKQIGIATPEAASLASASLSPPIPWPYMSTPGQQNAYTWISRQLCCDSIRSTYTNLNIDPTVWLGLMNQIAFNADSATANNFSQEDFDDETDQLAKEFAYVSLVRNLQSNILSLFQDQQSNVSLLITQAGSDILADVATTQPQPIQPSAWSAFTSDVLPVISNLTSFFGPEGTVAYNALGIGTLIINNAADHSNDPSGISQAMQSLATQDIAQGQVAQQKADQYTNSLVAMGNDFKRVVTDWGRLSQVGGAIVGGKLNWDPTASGIFLRAFDLTTRRQLYPELMHLNSNFYIDQLRWSDVTYYASDSDAQGCAQSIFPAAQDNGGMYGGQDLRGTAYWPGAVQVLQNNAQDRFPNAYWWDVWALAAHSSTKGSCPHPADGALPNTYGMFDPVANTPSGSTNGLGIWKPYAFEYRFGAWRVHTNDYFYPNVP